MTRWLIKRGLGWGLGWGVSRAVISPVFWSHTPGSGCSQVSSCGSVGLRCGSCFAASHHGWTQAAPRSVCAFSPTFGSRSVEDLWFDLQGKGASPAKKEMWCISINYILFKLFSMRSSGWTCTGPYFFLQCLQGVIVILCLTVFKFLINLRLFSPLVH